MNERMARSVLSMIVFTRSFCIDKIQIVKFSSCMAASGLTQRIDGNDCSTEIEFCVSYS